MRATVGQRLEPLLGPAAPVLFAAGLFAAGLTSSITAPLAAAYAVSGAFGWPPDLRSTRLRLLGGFVLVTGVLFGVLFGGSPYRVIILAQAANALFLPVVLVLLLIIAKPGRDHGPLPQLPPDQRPRRAGGAGHRRALGSATRPPVPESWNSGQPPGVRFFSAPSTGFTRGSDCRNRSGGNRP